MSLDGIFLKNLCRELNSAADSRIDKIFQPSRDEFVLSLRCAAGTKKLLLCARPGLSRLQFTDASFENPAVPPMLCMLFRKHLSGGKILSFSQDGYERVVTIAISATDELGDRKVFNLIIELIGNQSNIILCDCDSRIIDAVRRLDIEASTRMIQPGAFYEAPKKPQKRSVCDSDAFEYVLKNENDTVFYAVMNSLSGVSPLIARELALSLNEKRICELNSEEKALLLKSLNALKAAAENGRPYIIYDEKGEPKDFSFMEILQQGCKSEETDSFSSLLDKFYFERDRLARLRQGAADVYKTLSNAQARAEKKLFLRKEELKKCEKKETLRIYGELIKANIALIEKGAEFARVPNYYDENLALINIPLNPALSAASNSAKYFKDYRKLCSAEQILDALIKENEQEITYLASIKDTLERSETLAEILDIKDELALAGYIRRQQRKAVKRQKLKPLEYLSPDGYKILVGRNNIQNDELTLKTAAKDDIWLHTKNIHGSHVIIKTDGTTPPDSTVLIAAELAAYHSQARNSSQVPVDYTAVKHVKKPSGAKPGMVIYKTNSTVFVTPKEY